MRVLPRFIGRGVLVSYALHDIAFLMVAIFAAFALPPSVESTLTVYAWTWIITLALGSVCGIVGTTMKNVRMEVLGCGLMISGLVIYSAALLVKVVGHGNMSGLAAVGIFMAASFSLCSRIFVMYAAIYLRESRP
jgi:hypothetical protein